MKRYFRKRAGALPDDWSPIRSSAPVRRTAAAMIIVYLVLSIAPIAWIALTSFKSEADAVAYPPKVMFEPSLVGYVNLFTSRTRLSAADQEKLPPPKTWYGQIVRDEDMVISGSSPFLGRFENSLIIAFISTFFAISLGVIAAYAYVRLPVFGRDDQLFFILSTRFMPPVAVALPIFLMYRHIGLNDTYLGMIVLYTAFNVSFAVWLLKGFFADIPKEYEEAAMVDGYSRLQAFVRFVLPNAKAGIAATTVFCLIFAWNEYTYSLLLTSRHAQTATPYIPNIVGYGGLDWSAVAAGTTLFLIPVMVFTVLLRKYLVRGVTFGAVRG